jgi:methionyl-tRNA synthetase
MIVKYCDSIVPGHENINDVDKKFLSKISNDLDELSILIDNQEINIYIRKIWDIISDANKYFNDYKPWELKDSNRLAFNNVLYVTADIIKQIGVMIYPIMPNTSEKILDFFDIEIDHISFELLNTNVAKVKIDHIKPLFPRVE